MTLVYPVLGMSLVLVITRFLLKPTLTGLLSPFGMFSAFFSFVYFVVPAIQDISNVGNSLYLVDSGARQIIADAMLIATLYYGASALGFVLAKPKVQDPYSLRRAAARPGTEERGLVFLLGTMQMASAVGILWLVLPYVRTNYADFMANRIAISAGLGYLMMPQTLGATAALLVAAVPLATHGHITRSHVLPLAWFLGVTAISSVLTGNRMFAISGVIYVTVAAAVLRRGKGRIGAIVAICAASLVLITALGAVRVFVATGGYHYQSAPASVGVGEKELVKEFAADFGQLELLAFAREHSAEWDFANGQTYLAAVLNFIPRAWWREKPLGAGPMLANIVRPGSYNLEKKYSTGFTTGCVTEAYLNRGLVGVIIVGALHGWLIGLVTRYGWRIRQRYQFVAYMLCMFFFAEMTVYGEMLGSVARAGVLILPIWVYCSVRRRLPAAVTLAPQGQA